MKKKKILLIVAVVAILGFALVFGAVFGMKFAGVGVEEEKEVDILSEEVSQLDIGEMYSNLSESKKIVKLNLTAAVSDKEVLTLMQSKMPIIKDEINKTFRGKTEEDIYGVSGQMNIKSELITKLNDIFRTDGVIDIYFNEFIVQ
jgi:flagellar protein FliL